MFSIISGNSMIIMQFNFNAKKFFISHNGTRKLFLIMHIVFLLMPVH